MLSSCPIIIAKPTRGAGLVEPKISSGLIEKTRAVVKQPPGEEGVEEGWQDDVPVGERVLALELGGTKMRLSIVWL